MKLASLTLNTPRGASALWATLAVTVMSLAGCGQQGADAPGMDVLAEASAHPDEADASHDELAHLRHPPADPRAALQHALATGQLSPHGDARDFLEQLLRTCGVPPASQVLVFSKTSMQSPLISPANPRAIYFSDDFYVGYVPGGVIEISDTDPDDGTGFYELDIRPRNRPRNQVPGMRDEPPTLTQPVQCLNCHSGSRTNNSVGLLVRSVYPDAEGFPITSAGSFVTTHASPLEHRWGGWYVTGHHGTMRHMGNTLAQDLGDDARLDPEPGANRVTLEGLVDTSRHLAPGSDIAALMVLEHQVPMHNLLTQGALAVKRQTFRSRRVAEHDGGTFDPYASETLMSVVGSHAGRIARHLLFVDEAPLTDTVVGDRAFVRQFRANRREAHTGRSLKDLDLHTRLFRYRCSYMVYSRAFEQMPPLLKEAVYRELYDALAGPETELNAHLDAEERAEILMILRETKDGLPGYWRG